MLWEQNAAGEYIRLRITKEQAYHTTPRGTDAAPFVAELMQAKPIAAQLAELDRAAVVAYLKEFGAWDDVDENEQTEQGRTENNSRLVWVACCDINEGDF
jgi:hypothetical protein